MSDNFFKFPSTPHLLITNDQQIRADKVMTAAERQSFLQQELVVEEKIDGANLGLSFNKQGELQAQNRGSYLQLPANGQWKPLLAWIKKHTDTLFEELLDRYILFGEWCYAQHTVAYTALPDWFIGFDIYDKQQQCFLSTKKRDKKFDSMNISKVPLLGTGRFTLEALNRLLSEASAFGSEQREGIYLRQDNPDCLLKRAKLVRPAFIQADEQHWSKRLLQTNRIALDTVF